jgi:hypothetical protein
MLVIKVKFYELKRVRCYYTNCVVIVYFGGCIDICDNLLLLNPSISISVGTSTWDVLDKLGWGRCKVSQGS